jgi:hypothetical protein
LGLQNCANICPRLNELKTAGPTRRGYRELGLWARPNCLGTSGHCTSKSHRWCQPASSTYGHGYRYHSRPSHCRAFDVPADWHAPFRVGVTIVRTGS